MVDRGEAATLAAYRRAAARVARPLRIAGLALAVLAVVLAVVLAAWPGLPVAVPLAVAGAALLHLLAAISVRLRRPKRRASARGSSASRS